MLTTDPDHADEDADADAADTLRFAAQGFDADAPTDPDATSIYDLASVPLATHGIERASSTRRRMIRAGRRSADRNTP